MTGFAAAGDLGAGEIVRMLGLERHPEGGWYRETVRDASPGQVRARSTAILYLLPVDEISAWHQVDAGEHWFWHAGGALALTVSDDGESARSITLGPDLRAGQSPQAFVPPNAWQTAESLGAWTLVSCVVAPGFEFEGFKLAPRDWFPGADAP